jgi:hypothetical protein
VGGPADVFVVCVLDMGDKEFRVAGHQQRIIPAVCAEVEDFQVCAYDRRIPHKLVASERFVDGL